VRIVRNVGLLIGTLVAMLVTLAIVTRLLAGYPYWVSILARGALLVGLWAAVSRAQRRENQRPDDGS
jgi:hypothetical protein